MNIGQAGSSTCAYRTDTEPRNKPIVHKLQCYDGNKGLKENITKGPSLHKVTKGFFVEVAFEEREG